MVYGMYGIVLLTMTLAVATAAVKDAQLAKAAKNR
jgi:hypothetical protein